VDTVRKRVKKRSVKLKFKLFALFAGWNFWVSASDIGQSPHGQYLWADGSPVDNSLWASKEPNRAGAGKETCVSLDTGYVKLRDARCSGSVYILCELPAALSSCF
jgi:hypothetical protein